MENQTPRPPQPIRITREQIESTEAFKNATKMIQMITLKRTNSRCIEHGVNVATNIGFDRWDHQTQSSFTNREIIRELIQTENENQ